MNSGPSKYTLSPDDPILISRIDAQMEWMSDRTGKKITPEEFPEIFPEIKDHYLKEIQEKIEYNQWAKQVNGKLWYDAVHYTIENKFLENEKVRRSLMKAASDAWGGDYGEKYHKQSYNQFVARMQAHADKVGAKLYSRPPVGSEYISYYFRTINPNNYKGLSLRSNRDKYTLKSLLSDALNKDVEKFKPGSSERAFVENMKPKILQHAERTGLGILEDPLHSSFYEIESVSEEEGIFRFNATVSKRGFLEFYDNNSLHTPPEYFYEAYDYIIENKIKSHVEAFLKNNFITPKRFTAEEIETFKRDAQRKAESVYSQELKFLKSERRIRADYAFIINDVNDNPNRPSLVMGYKMLANYTDENEFEDIEARYSSFGFGRSSRASDPVIPIMPPYLWKYPAKQINSCPQYLKWVRCTVQHWPDRFFCKDAPLKEPEMCK